MVIVENRRWVWKDKLVFFPNQEELHNLIQSLSPNDVLDIRQTEVSIDYHPNLIERHFFGTSCIDLTKELEVIYREMDAKSCRYSIRKAEKIKGGTQIRQNDSEANEDFFELYNNFARLKDGVHPISRRGFQEYLKVSDIFVIYFNEHPMCGHVLIHDQILKRVRLILSASSRLESKEIAAVSSSLNRYLHWHELQTYKHAGFEVYDFGGVGDGSSSIAQFKLSFGGYRLEETNYLFAGVLGNLGNKIRTWTKPFRNYWRG